jgi:hypothetical protein
MRIPGADVVRVGEAAARTVRAAAAEGVGGRPVGSRVLRDALLDHVPIVVTADGGARIPVSQRLVQAVIRMGFTSAADGDFVDVRIAGPWTPWPAHMALPGIAGRITTHRIDGHKTLTRTGGARVKLGAAETRPNGYRPLSGPPPSEADRRRTAHAGGGARGAGSRTMPRWPWRAEQPNGSTTDSIVAQLPRDDATPTLDGARETPQEDAAGLVSPVTLLRWRRRSRSSRSDT